MHRLIDYLSNSTGSPLNITKFVASFAFVSKYTFILMKYETRSDRKSKYDRLRDR